MGLHNLRKWGYPQENCLEMDPPGLEVLTADSQFGKVQKQGGLSGMIGRVIDGITSIIIKLCALGALLACVLLLAFCLYALGNNLMPVLKERICEAPVVE